MAIVSLPYAFTAGQVIFSAQVNLNFSTIYAAFNGNIDSTNISPSVGIGANYIVSSGSGATGLFTPGSFQFTSNTVGTTPLVVQGVSGQTAPLQNWESYTGALLANVDYIGNIISYNGGLVASYSLYPLFIGPGATGNQPSIFNDGGAVNGMSFNISATATNGYTFYQYGTGYTAIAAFSGVTFEFGNNVNGGNFYVGQLGTSKLVTLICATSGGSGSIVLGNGTPTTNANYIVRGTRDTYPYVYGVYNGNCHIVTGVTAVTITSTGGPPYYGTTVVSLPTSGQSFTSAGSYVVIASYAGAATNNVIAGAASIISGSSFTLIASSSTGIGTVNIQWIAIGS